MSVPEKDEFIERTEQRLKDAINEAIKKEFKLLKFDIEKYLDSYVFFVLAEELYTDYLADYGDLLADRDLKEV